MSRLNPSLLAALALLTSAGCSMPTLSLDPGSEIPVVSEETETPTLPADLSGVPSLSGTMVPSADGTFAVAVDPDLQRLSMLPLVPAGGAARLLDVGGEVGRVLRVGDDFYATLREAGRIVRFQVASDGSASVLDVADVGTEPFDLAVTGNQIFISLSLDNAVVQVNAELEEVRRWEVQAEPRWIAVHEDEGVRELVVSSIRSPLLTRIDLISGEVASMPLPQVTRFRDTGCDDRLLHGRITGASVLGADGHTLYVPALYADTLLPASPDDLEREVEADPCAEPSIFGDIGSPNGGEGGGGAYGGEGDFTMPGKKSRLNPVFIKMDLHRPGAATVHALGAGAIDPVAIFGFGVRKGFPTSLLVLEERGEDTLLVATMENSEALVVVDLSSVSMMEDLGEDLVSNPRVAIPLDAHVSELSLNPMQDTDIWGWSYLDQRANRYSSDLIETAVETGEDRFGFGSLTGQMSLFEPEQTVATENSLAREVIAGRKLFYTSTNPVMAGNSSGVSCSTCHYEGRTDGLTWQFPDMPRQTPSLAGAVSETAPFTWTGTVATVAEEAQRTSSQRMGGEGVGSDQASQLAAYVDWSRATMAPEHDPAIVARGKEIFERVGVGCAACHAGATMSDGLVHDLPGRPLGLNTPTLVGLAGSAPYLHDGSAATAYDLVVASRDGSMGDTSSLSDTEMRALATYLRSL